MKFDRKLTPEERKELTREGCYEYAKWIHGSDRKQCPSCKETLSIYDYYIHKGGKDALNQKCVNCLHRASTKRYPDYSKREEAKNKFYEKPDRKPTVDIEKPEKMIEILNAALSLKLSDILIYDGSTGKTTVRCPDSVTSDIFLFFIESITTNGLTVTSLKFNTKFIQDIIKNLLVKSTILLPEGDGGKVAIQQIFNKENKIGNELELARKRVENLNEKLKEEEK